MQLRRSFSTVNEGLAVEMQMLDYMTTGHGPASVAMIWHAENPAITVPMTIARSDKFAEANQSSTLAGMPIFPRRTGGGATPQGPGVLNLTLCFRVQSPNTPSIEATYALLYQPILAALTACGLTAVPGTVNASFCDGAHNLAIGGRKIVGTAQRWRKLRGDGEVKGGVAILAHALILTSLDLTVALEAINRLHGYIDRPACDPDKHITLADCLGQKSSAEKIFVSELDRAVREMSLFRTAPLG